MKVSLTPHQKKFIAEKMNTGGYVSQSEIIREALRVYELVEEEDYDPGLERALCHALRSPTKRYTKGHFVRLASNGKKRIAA